MKVKRFFSRRTFLATTAVAGLGGVWAATSPSWTARFLRERLAETGRAIPRAARKPEPSKWSDNAVTMAWLGHATVLMNFYGVRILLDPVLYSRIGLHAVLGTIGPQRLVACALRPKELPEIDLVLLSHAHFDHLDTRSLSAIRGKPVAVMAPETADLLPRRNYSAVHEMRWGETRQIATRRGKVQVRGLEVRHWGARIRRDTHRGYNGYVIEREGRKLLLGGDTANTPIFAQHRIPGGYDAAIMPVGAYDPWIHSHCNPEEAVAMANDAGAKYFVPIHHQSFNLSNEPFHEPIERTAAALGDEPERLALRDIGETFVLQA
jgi:L-ascorbate metabolism protein UlaG (beta-lactamase superfamily)